MKVNVRTISKEIVNGTDPEMKHALEVMSCIVHRPHSEEAVEMIHALRMGEDDIDGVLRGLYNHILRIQYLGSRGVSENLAGILQAPSWEEAKGIMNQWKALEEAMWEVVPTEETK